MAAGDMHVRNIRKLREDGSGPGDGSSGSARSRSSQLSRADGSPRKRRPSTLSISMDESVASVMSPASPLPALTLDVEEYLNLLAGKHDTTASAKLTAHLSAEELQEQLAMGEQELVDTKKRGACIVKSISLLKKLEAAVSASLEEDAFAERLIRHQQDLVQRARAERGDQSLREANLTKDVEKLERNYQRVAKSLAGVQTRRNADHDSFMAAFKKQASLMRELESTVARRLGGMAERAANLRRSVQLLHTRSRNRGRGPGTKPRDGGSNRRGGRASPDTHGSNDDNDDDTKVSGRRGRRNRAPTTGGSSRRIVRAPSHRSTRRPLSGRPSGESAATTQLILAEKEKAAAQRTNNRLVAKNKELQKALMEKAAALVEKENLVMALRRQQKEQVMALQKKVVTISKQLHQIHVDDLEA